jgi:hypothetical protein
MGTVNEVVRRKLEAHAKVNKAEAQLALKAIELAEKHGNDASVAEQLAIVVRQLTKEKK